ncbi:peroxide stress protein YaaA [Oribacterium parvum]|uniref:peroxide stress protein YaaA n=1 Tax=Oribacterium parvum TaxID=1501329 RepID=UPI0028E2A68E|nr:peroxide stress protein YaaA [Oribacterium parvum]
MRIILSPAKKMRNDENGPAYRDLPVFLSDAEKIKASLKEKSFSELKALWACNDKIAEQNIERLSSMDLREQLSPAILSYDGIAYQYMAPTVFETEMLRYVQEHLRILSGFYGILKPMDGVTAYRLEMQAKLELCGAKNLYDYWGDRLYRELRDSSGIIVNLASKEYSKCIEKYLQPGDCYISCNFYEEVQGKPVQKGVYCKMARGEMVRFMAENRIEEPEEIKQFSVMGYRFSEELSSEKEYVYVRKQE